MYAVILVLALLGQILDVGYLFHFLFFAVLWLPVLGLAVSLPAMLGCRAELLVRAPRVHRGEEAAWKLRLTGRSRLPLARVAGRVCLTERMHAARARHRLSMRRALPVPP